MSPADEAVDLALALVRLDTVNPGLVPGAPGEGAAVQLLADRLTRQGFGVEVVAAPTAPDRVSLVATSPGRGRGPTLVLNGHLDTVGAGRMAHPFDPRVVGDRETGRLTGRGSCDMKAGVASMVVAAEQATRAGSSADVVLALVADEENASLGTQAVLEHLAERGVRPDACIVGEPTWLDLVVAHRGFALVEVELSGVTAHSSRPDEGRNAVTHLGRLLGAVEERDRELAAGPAHAYAGSGSLLATVAGGGEAPFTLASTAHATLERRTLPGESPNVGLAEVEAILDRLSEDDPDVKGRCRQVLARDAWELDEDHPMVERLVRQLAVRIAAAGRPRPQRVGAPYWMESALWQQAGIPAVVCGPAGGGPHADDEWVDLAQVRAYTDALAGVIVGLGS